MNFIEESINLEVAELHEDLEDWTLLACVTRRQKLPHQLLEDLDIEDTKSYRWQARSKRRAIVDKDRWIRAEAYGVNRLCQDHAGSSEW